MLRRTTPKLYVGVVLACIGLLGYAIHMNTRPIVADPASYKPLLDLIADAESKGNYNAYFGNANNQSIDFTKMTITQVQEWQKSTIQQGHASSAVGRYQIIDTTLGELVAQQRIDPSSKFDSSLQDQLAIALLERRGSLSYLRGELTSEQFAANLAKEWASLPRITGPKPESSYYAGDGLNISLVDSQQVLGAVSQLKPE